MQKILNIKVVFVMLHVLYIHPENAINTVLCLSIIAYTVSQFFILVHIYRATANFLKYMACALMYFCINISLCHETIKENIFLKLCSLLLTVFCCFSSNNFKPYKKLLFYCCDLLIFVTFF